MEHIFKLTPDLKLIAVEEVDFDQNSVGTEYFSALLDGWALGENETLFVAFEKKEQDKTVTLSPTILRKEKGRGLYFTPMPDEVMELAGEWSACIYKIFNYDEDLKRGETQKVGEEYFFTVTATIPTASGKAATKYDVINIYEVFKELEDTVIDVKAANSAADRAKAAAESAEQSHKAAEEVVDAAVEKIESTLASPGLGRVPAWTVINFSQLREQIPGIYHEIHFTFNSGSVGECKGLFPSDGEDGSQIMYALERPTEEDGDTGVFYDGKSGFAVATSITLTRDLEFKNAEFKAWLLANTDLTEEALEPTLDYHHVKSINGKTGELENVATTNEEQSITALYHFNDEEFGVYETIVGCGGISVYENEEGGVVGIPLVTELNSRGVRVGNADYGYTFYQNGKILISARGASDEYGDDGYIELKLPGESGTLATLEAIENAGYLTDADAAKTYLSKEDAEKTYLAKDEGGGSDFDPNGYYTGMKVGAAINADHAMNADFAGSATTDQNGDNIADTYLKKEDADAKYATQDSLNMLQAQLNAKVYPVGSYYISNEATPTPAQMYGGSWTAVTGRFLYCNAGTSTGGSNTHTLTISEMPSHTHTERLYIQSSNAGTAQNIALAQTWTKYEDISGPATSAVGGGSSFSTMPAYQTVYAWRRTA